MSVLTNNMSDIINISDRAIMEEIAKTDDHPVLMINQNLYTAKAEFPNGELYKEWRAICLLYTSPSPRDRQKSRMPSSA